jgi:formylglycine-generating enzyme required for sulfatase activity
LAVAQHGYNFDASVEAAVWQHPDMLELSSVAATPNPAARSQWLERFGTLPDPLKQTVLGIIRQWRAPLREQVWFEEISSLDASSRQVVPQADLVDANQYFKQLSQRYDGDDAEVQTDVATRSWFRRMEKRLPPETWDLPDVGVALHRISAQVHQHETRHQTDHALDPAKLVASSMPEQTMTLYQQGESLWVGQSPVAAGLSVGSRLAQIRLRRGLLYAEVLPESGDKPAPQPVRQSLQFQLDGVGQETLCALLNVVGVMVRSDTETLYFKQVQRPTWADSIGRDSEGLFIEHHYLGKHYRSYWQPPTTDGAGHWQGLPPGDIGTDSYGLYADLDIKDIPQRFRWIEPGTFFMGSPESEAGRYGDEVQHQVTLTQGFWLADTTVTQSQWQAVMGNNPSSFTDNPNNPVENVSWNDIQDFIQKLNARIPDLQAKLPTEAQWEYACRAGTTTPFSFGDNITPEQVNYHGNNPYSGGEKGLYREKTVPVKSLPANPWGLFEMHGNVREWCQDMWQEKLSASPITDPEGVTGGGKAGVRRVVRGGSWYDDGGGCRSACRDGDGPVVRLNSDLGFRLSLGHVELRPGQGGGAAGSGATNQHSRADGAGAGRRGAGDTTDRDSTGSGGLVDKLFNGLTKSFRKKK